MVLTGIGPIKETRHVFPHITQLESISTSGALKRGVQMAVLQKLRQRRTQQPSSEPPGPYEGSFDLSAYGIQLSAPPLVRPASLNRYIHIGNSGTRFAELAEALSAHAGKTRGRMIRIRRSLGLISIFIALSLTAAAAQDRHGQAVAIINAAVTASGMNPNAPFPNFIASGQVQYYWTSGVVTGNATVSSAGNKQFRLDAQVSGGTRVLDRERS